MKCDPLKSNFGKTFQDLLLITPRVFFDERGFFFESWNKKSFEKLVGKSINFVQDNHSGSQEGVLRGLHYQLPPYDQGKLVTCIVGEVFDVVVDLRKNSSTFKHWVGVNLSNTNHKMLWIPSGFAHGFLTISQYAEITYKVTNFWKKDFERSLCWNDPEINIDWPLNIEQLSLSSKDKNCFRISQLHPNETF